MIYTCTVPLRLKVPDTFISPATISRQVLASQTPRTLGSALESVSYHTGTGSPIISQYSTLAPTTPLSALKSFSYNTAGIQVASRSILAPKYAVKDFAQVSGKISQKQLRHIAERAEYRGGGYLNSVDDAQAVLNDFRSGKTSILGKSKQGFPIVRHEGVTGTNVNVSAGFPNQPTNVFMIKGTKSPSVVPMNPNWKP